MHGGISFLSYFIFYLYFYLYFYFYLSLALGAVVHYQVGSGHGIGVPTPQGERNVMKPEIIELVEALKAFEAGENIKLDAEGYVEDPRADNICRLADVALITNEGRPNWSAMAELRKEGYIVERGEYDSFGWLTGVIHTRKGYIVYG